MLLRLDFDRSVQWWFNAEDQKAAQILLDKKAKNVNVHWYNYRSTNYYLLDKIKVQEVRNPSELNPNFEYFYTNKDAYEAKILDKYKWELIQTFEKGESLLYRNKYYINKY